MGDSTREQLEECWFGLRALIADLDQDSYNDRQHRLHADICCEHQASTIEYTRCYGVVTLSN
jgi:hypothetical protein